MATRSLAALVAVLAVSPASAIAAPPAQSSASCTVSAQGPFLYVDIVIPVASVQCDTQQRRLHIETELTRDGVVVATASRSCRNASVCWQSVDASAPDVPGNQLWCLTTRGSVGSTFVGEASSCEQEEF
jgi:hypothetical protein